VDVAGNRGPQNVQPAAADEGFSQRCLFLVVVKQLFRHARLFTQSEQVVLTRRPQHHTGIDHRQQLITARIFQHAAQSQVAVYQYTIVIEIRKQRGQALPGTVQHGAILLRQLRGVDVHQRSPQYFQPLAIPVRPTVFLCAVHRADATVAIDPMPGQHTFDNLIHQQRPTLRRTGRRFYRHAAQALDKQQFLIRRLMGHHHPVDRRQPDFAFPGQHGQLVGLLPGDPLADIAFCQQRHSVARAIIQGIQMRIGLFTDAFKATERLAQHGTQLGF